MTVFLEILTSGRKIERVSTAATDKIQGQQEVPLIIPSPPLMKNLPLTSRIIFLCPSTIDPKKNFALKLRGGGEGGRNHENFMQPIYESMLVIYHNSLPNRTPQLSN